MAKDIDLSTITKAYAKWAPIYDKFYKNMLREGQLKAAKAAILCGQDILEVGVGTGLSLGDYPPSHSVTGIDLSKAMLDRAAAKVRAQHLTSVKGLAVMDACRLGFRAESFDAVVGQFMITLVPDAEAALDEFRRVLRPGGEIVLVNHIGAESGPVAAFERLIAPLAKRVGWRAEFKLQRLRDWAAASGFVVASVERVSPFGFFTVIRLRDGRQRALSADAA